MSCDRLAARAAVTCATPRPGRLRCDLAVLRDEACVLQQVALEATVIRLITLGIACTPLFAGCGTGPADSASSDSNPASAVQSPTTDTADPAPAAPAMVGPTTGSTGSSTVTVIASDDGPAGVAIDGASDAASFATASYSIDPSANAMTADATITPASGAAFVFVVRGTHSGYSSTLRLQRGPGSTSLVTTTSIGTVACGDVSDRPTQVAVVLDPSGQRFDVLLDGAATQCSGLPTTMGAPLTSMGLMDASNDGWGGRVELGDPQMF